MHSWSIWSNSKVWARVKKSFSLNEEKVKTHSHTTTGDNAGIKIFLESLPTQILDSRVKTSFSFSRLPLLRHFTEKSKKKLIIEYFRKIPKWHYSGCTAAYYRRHGSFRISYQQWVINKNGLVFWVLFARIRWSVLLILKTHLFQKCRHESLRVNICYIKSYISQYDDPTKPVTGPSILSSPRRSVVICSISSYLSVTSGTLFGGLPSHPTPVSQQ